MHTPIFAQAFFRVHAVTVIHPMPDQYSRKGKLTVGLYSALQNCAVTTYRNLEIAAHDVLMTIHV